MQVIIWFLFFYLNLTLCLGSFERTVLLGARFVLPILMAGKLICHYGYLAGSGLPAWTPDYDTSAVKPLVAAVADIVSASDGMVLFGDTAMSADPANTYLEYVSQVYGGAINGEDFVSGLTNDLG